MSKRIPIPVPVAVVGLDGSQHSASHPAPSTSGGRASRLSPPPPGIHVAAAVVDQRQRPLRDLRLSVSDQCNLRCRYCMPREVFNRDYEFLPRESLLSFEAIEHLVRAAIPLGVRKLRITGGEPLLRKNLPDLIGRLSGLVTGEGQPLEIALTTNGVLLRSQASALKAAGLQRVTVSLDALNESAFQAMADAPDIRPQSILEGIDAAESAGLAVKVNMVVQRGVNEDQILPMAEHFRWRNATLRFIEFMDVGSTNQWSSQQVVPSAEIIGRIGQRYALRRVGRSDAHEVSERWAYADGAGQIGLISSISQPFCGGCSRARISAEGGFYTCLFASRGTDLVPLISEPQLGHALLGPEGLDKTSASLAAIWSARNDRYSELRWELAQKTRPEAMESHGTKGRVEMSYIGG